MKVEKRQISFLIASLLCFPLLAFAVLFGIGFLLDLVCGDCPDAIALAVLWGVWRVAESPIWVSLALGVLSLAVLAAWYQSQKTKPVVALLALYSVGIIACASYLVWWHASGKVFDL